MKLMTSGLYNEPVGGISSFRTLLKRSATSRNVDLQHFCAACCWGLMLIFVAAGVMNIPATAALTIVIFVEKLLRHGQALLL